MLSLSVRLIWKDFLHSKKQQDLIIEVHYNMQQGSLRNTYHLGHFKIVLMRHQQKTLREAVHSKELWLLDLLDLFHH